MQARIRHIARRRKGLITEREKLIDKQTISLGRATDQDIFLSDGTVAYRHARINLLPNRSVSVTSVNRLGFYIEDNLVQNCLIKQNGELQVGVYRIKIDIDKKADLVDITIEKLAVDLIATQGSKDLPIKLEQTWLSKRQLSWLGFIMVLAVFLGIPMAAYYDERAEKLVQQYHLPDDDLWLAGEISAPHKHFANDCKQCHQQPFVRVRDTACLECHDDITTHVDPDFFDIEELNQTSCAICHHEHEGTSELVQRDQQMCSDCHGNLGELVKTDLNSITDFATDHSEFRATLMPGRGTSRFDPNAWQRVSLDDRSIRHDTGMIFPHDLHIDREGVRGPNGRQVLRCDDCHQTDAGGDYMLPITMEKHCQSCHRLKFDPADPERELPHSDLKNLRKMLNEYYSLAALRGGIEELRAPDLITQRRRPGKELTREETGIALQWALEKAEDVALEVIEFRSCNLCHKVERDETAELGWVIPEVHMAQGRWFPKGFFSHDSHHSTDCETCHHALLSSRSEDVLLPGIKVCRECHGGQHAESLLQSTCIECHSFHQPDELLMRIARGQSGG